MYQIRFYRDRRGHEPVREFLDDLSKQKDRRSRKLCHLIQRSIEDLSRRGLALGMPNIRRIDEDIRELHLQRYRIFLFGWNGDSFVLLQHYYKKTEKTPRSEIEKAHREMEHYLKEERNGRE